MNVLDQLAKKYQGQPTQTANAPTKPATQTAQATPIMPTDEPGNAEARKRALIAELMRRQQMRTK